MNSRHIIRLRSPWELLTDPSRKEPPQRVEIPLDLRAQFPDSSTKTLLLSRRFHPPRQLPDGEKIFCVLHQTPGLHSLKLNDRELLTECTRIPDLIDSLEIDITSLLQPNNTLELTFLLTSPTPCGILGEVSLQIETP